MLDLREPPYRLIGGHNSRSGLPGHVPGSPRIARLSYLGSVAMLRTEAGRDPYEKTLTGTVASRHPAFSSPQILHWRFENGPHGATKSPRRADNNALSRPIRAGAHGARCRSWGRTSARGS